MDTRDTIRRRIIDRAVDLFSKDNPNGGGLFTTAHYGQAMKAEFGMPGPCPDAVTCMEHLVEMDDIERAGGNMWRRLAQRGGRVQSDITGRRLSEGEAKDVDKATGEAMARAKAGIMRVFAGGGQTLTANTLVSLLKDDVLPESAVATLCEPDESDADVVSGIVGCALYALTTEGELTQRWAAGSEALFGLKKDMDAPGGGACDCDPQLLEIEDTVKAGVMGILSDGGSGAVPDVSGSMWWSVETMADALKNNDLVWDGLLENMVGLVLYAMAVDGRAVARPNMLVDGARVTVFALAPKGATEDRPPSGRPPSDGWPG